MSGGLRAKIHRGASEIGGNCVELEARGKRLVLDLGRPLWAELSDDLPLPSIEGLSDGSDPSLLGVILSHAHLDHYGLVHQVDAAVPLYTGAAAARILKEAAFFSPASLDRDWAGFIAEGEPLELAPFTVTPFLVDHSAFDAYALLVEAEGQRLFYSGDLRAHGPDPGVFERLLAEPPKGINVLLLEGTRVGLDADTQRSAQSEADLEDEFIELFGETEGLVLVVYSAQNLDRLVTLYRAVLESDRELVIDPYVDAMARATGNPDMPHADSQRVRVYIPNSQRVKIKRSQEFERADRLRHHRLFPEALPARRRELVMTFRPSMAAELERAGCLEGAQVAWSMWRGYLDDERSQPFRELCERNAIPVSVIHASGHATVADLKRLAEALAPERIVPIHTAAPERYPELFADVEPHPDGEWWEV